MDEVAENGVVALRFHQNNPFNIILTDIDMPVMDGRELTRRIRKQEKTRNLQRFPLLAYLAISFKKTSMPRELLR